MLLVALLSVAWAQDDVEEKNTRLVQRKPRATAMLLHDMMGDADAAGQLQLRYWMARSFQRIELYHTAQRYYLTVLAAGQSRWHHEALISLVGLTDRIGDDADLIAAVAALDSTAFPERVASSLHYLQGVGLHERGAGEEAIVALSAVPYGTSRYFTARLRLAVVLTELDRRDAARDVLVDLLAVRPYGTRIQQQDARKLQSLALVDLARLYYAAGRFAEAGRLYAQVSRRSPWRAVADLEGGWAALMIGDHAAATLAGTTASTTDFLPEGEILAAYAALSSSGCAAAAPRLEAFIETYRPMEQELIRTGRMSGEDQWGWWFGDEVLTERALPVSFFSRMLRDQQLAGAIYRTDRIRWERALARGQPAEWVDTVGVGVIPMLKSDHQTVQARMFTRLAARTDTLRTELIALLEDAEAMQVSCTGVL